MGKNMAVNQFVQPTEHQGFVETLNEMGYMCTTLDEVSLDFVRAASQSSLPSLEIGAAYGVATISAIEQGAHMIANDIDVRHLQVLKDSIGQNKQSRLSLLPGKFPDELNVTDCSILNILISRVLHFFTGKEITDALTIAHKWLKPGGRIFIINETPFLKNWQNIVPIYNEKKEKGIEFPGEFSNLREIAETDRAKSLPNFFHFLDKESMRHLLEKSGFNVEKVQYISRPYFPEDIRLNGRESVGAVGFKVC